MCISQGATHLSQAMAASSHVLELTWWDVRPTPVSSASYLALSIIIPHRRAAAHCLLLTTHCSLLTAHCSLLTAYCLLLTTHYSLLTAYCLLLTTYYSLLTAYYSLLTAYCLLLTTHYSLLTTHCSPQLSASERTNRRRSCPGQTGPTPGPESQTIAGS